MTIFAEEIKIIKNFIEKKLRKKLEKDQKELKILSEGDLQSCVYFHLRKFIRSKKFVEKWYLTNKLPMGKQRSQSKQVSQKKKLVKEDRKLVKTK